MSSLLWALAALATMSSLFVGCGQLPATSYGTVSGAVMAGPTCPVEQAGSPCPDRPLQTTVQIASLSGTVVASTRSDSHGRYALQVAPGVYLLVVQTAVWPRCPVLRIVVEAARPTGANVTCDTGIR
ncbi:MAG: hypothetical protein ACYCZN_09105 [Candidatus Dormibacteria bacterium]